MKLNYKRTFFVGLAFFAICAFWQLYDHVIPLMLKYTFGIGDAVTGMVMAADNVLALFMLPVFGRLSDRTNSRWGKRTPFIVVGTLGAVLTMFVIPLADRLYYNSIPQQAIANLGMGGAVVDDAARIAVLGMGSFAFKAIFVIGLGLVLLFMASYRSPAVALMPDVTPKPLRGQSNAIINLMGAIGGIIIMVLTSVLLTGADEGEVLYHPDYMPLFLACMAIMAVATVVLLLTSNEPKLVEKMRQESKAMGVEEQPPEQAGVKQPLPAPVKRSMAFLLASIALWFMGYNAVTSAFSRYAMERFALAGNESAQILVVAQAAAIISYLPVGFFATRFGRKKCILIGVVLLALSFGVAMAFTSFNPAIYVLFVTAGIAWAAINVNSYPMVVEMTRSADIGKFTGYYYTASMAAQIATPILSGILLQYVGYQTLFPYAALFVGLAFVTMLFVRHGDAKPVPLKSKLEAFEAPDD